MKAAQIVSYNKNNIALTVTDVPAPRPGAQQVLVKISTAGVNPLDNMISRGEVKLITPYALPQIAGNEIVGRVEALGEGVTSFKVGERVFARLPLHSIGAFAECVAVDAAALARVPEYLSDEEAAGVPLTALTVMQAFDLMGAQPGKTIFISGGTGGVGAMAIPLAKAKGLTVITTVAPPVRSACWVLALTASSTTRPKTTLKPSAVSTTCSTPSVATRLKNR